MGDSQNSTSICCDLPEFLILFNLLSNESSADNLSLAKIFSLQIKQPINSNSGNNFDFGRIGHDTNETHLSTTTNLGRSELLPLQEWACNRIGITFSH